MDKKKIIVLGVFLVSLFLMMAFAGGTPQNETIATRTVTFIDGYNNEEINTQVIEVGGNALVPSAPNYDNYTFLGWYDEAGNQIIDFTNILSDMKVFARYIENINNEIADVLVPGIDNQTELEYIIIPGQEYAYVGWSPTKFGTLGFSVNRNTNENKDKEEEKEDEFILGDTITLTKLSWNNGNKSGLNSFTVQGITIKQNKSYLLPEAFENVLSSNSGNRTIYTVLERNVDDTIYEKEYVIKVAFNKDGVWVLYYGTITVDNQGGNDNNQRVELTKVY